MNVSHTDLIWLAQKTNEGWMFAVVLEAIKDLHPATSYSYNIEMSMLSFLNWISVNKVCAHTDDTR